MRFQRHRKHCELRLRADQRPADRRVEQRRKDVDDLARLDAAPMPRGIR